MDCLHKYIAENIKNEHRVHHQLRILQSTFKDINIQNSYPYLVGSKIDIKEIYKINQKYIVMCPTNSKYHKKITEAIEHGHLKIGKN